MHTDVGNHAVAARVDKKLVPLRTKLASGQTVEIITAPSASPGPQWLEFVVSSKARTAIRHFLKRLQHEDAVDLGHRMLDRALEALRQLARPGAARSASTSYLAEHRYRRLEELLADIALGNRMPAQVAQVLVRGRGCAAARQRRVRRQRGDPDHRQRTRRAQLRAPAATRSRATRSWATSPPARAWSCTAPTARNVVEYRK